MFASDELLHAVAVVVWTDSWLASQKPRKRPLQDPCRQQRQIELRKWRMQSVKWQRCRSAWTVVSSLTVSCHQVVHQTLSRKASHQGSRVDAIRTKFSRLPSHRGCSLLSRARLVKTELSPSFTYIIYYLSIHVGMHIKWYPKAR